MINLKANEELKKLGCRWNGSEWIAPDLAKHEADKIKEKYYKDLIAIELCVSPDKSLPIKDWGYKNVCTVLGYIVASASGRDSGAIIQEGIAVLKGHFTSSGSIKNFYCTHSDELLLRMKISKNLLAELDEYVKKGFYTYTIVNSDKSKQDLINERDALLNKLAEIEKHLNLLN